MTVLTCSTLDACLHPEHLPTHPSFDVHRADVPEQCRAIVDRLIEVAFPRPAWEMIRYQVAAKWISARRATEILARQGGQQWLTRLLASPLGGVVRRLDVPYRLGDLVWTVFRRAGASA